MSYSLIVGDLEPDMFLTAAVSDVAQDLSDAVSVELLWRKPDGTESTVALTPVNAATGQYRRVWAAGDTDMAGVHRGRIVVTWDGPSDLTSADDEVQTFPNDGSWIIWYVYE